MAYWGNNALWQSLSGPQRAAAMALLEANVGNQGINVSNARNALGAIINRAESEGQSLSDHVSRSIYQPIIEDNQLRRLPQILQSPEFQQLTNLAEQRASGKVADWTGGADHYLAHPDVMLALEAKEPKKYRSWRNWTQFNPETNEYDNVVLKDDSHHFLDLLPNKDGQTSVPSSAPTKNKEDRAMIPFLTELLSTLGGSQAATTAASPTWMNTPMATPAGGSWMGQGQGGVLSDLFSGGGSPGNFGQALQKGLSGPEGMQLAQAAMQNASATGSPLSPLQMRQPDLSGLQNLLARKPMLGSMGV